MSKYLMSVLCVMGMSLILFQCTSQPDFEDVEPWFNPTLDMETRLDSLISAMTLEEKVSQMMDNAPEIERLGVPAWLRCSRRPLALPRPGMKS